MQNKDSSRRECCTDAPCDSGLRNQYFEGKRLTADSFRVEQSYLLERRRLLNRAIHGWGVVYGYAVTSVRGALEIGPGLALDECGRELLLARATTLNVEDAMLFDKKGKPLERPPEDSYEPYGKPEPEQIGVTHGEQHDEHRDDKARDDKSRRACWLLSAHYAEQDVGSIRINDPCSCERKEWDRLCETVRFSLRRIDCKDCCTAFDCELTCGCGTGPCCQPEASDEMLRHAVHRGGCQCLCDFLTGLSDTKCGILADVDDPCVHIRADWHKGVALACVSLREDECDNWVFDRWIDACGPRRLVKSNDTLFDLIRGCDLTRISAIGWEDWHRSTQPVRWTDFRDSFVAETPVGSGCNLTAKYWVEFSRPVREKTLQPECFSMTVIVDEDEGGWGMARRVPIVGVKTEAAPGTPSGFATRATLIVDAGWVDDALESRKTIFNQDAASVEIEVRGDFIVDCNGQTVDANARGLSPTPTGNGTPGGTFFSCFHVQARDARTTGYDSMPRTQGA